MNASSPTLDQLRIFLAVVDEGTFGAAARRLRRANSVISYGIANLEVQLGLTLFDREGSRRPQLTEAGRAVVSEARSIASDVDGLQAKIRGLLDGLEPEVALAVDVMMPPSRISAILRQFESEFPTVTLRLHVEALGAITAIVLEGGAHLGISGPIIVDNDRLERTGVGAVELIPVAAPGHSLARSTRLKPGEARSHLQLVLTDRSQLTAGKDFSVVSTRTWRLADLGAKHALLLEGIGWGNMPINLVETDIREGRLVRLDLPDEAGVTYAFSAIWRRDKPPGPATRWLLERFIATKT